MAVIPPIGHIDFNKTAGPAAYGKSDGSATQRVVLNDLNGDQFALAIKKNSSSDNEPKLGFFEKFLYAKLQIENESGDKVWVKVNRNSVAKRLGIDKNLVKGDVTEVVNRQIDVIQGHGQSAKIHRATFVDEGMGSHRSMKPQEEEFSTPSSEESSSSTSSEQESRVKKEAVIADLQDHNILWHKDNAEDESLSREELHEYGDICLELEAEDLEGIDDRTRLEIARKYFFEAGQKGDVEADFKVRLISKELMKEFEEGTTDYENNKTWALGGLRILVKDHDHDGAKIELAEMLLEQENPSSSDYNEAIELLLDVKGDEEREYAKGLLRNMDIEGIQNEEIKARVDQFINS